MKKVNMLFGTVYGSAQSVAEILADKLQALGYTPKLWHPSELSGFIPPENEYLLLICSTTGQGDLPDDILPWFAEIKAKAPYLPKLKYGVIGLGDSSYDTFCGAGQQLETLFAELGAKAVIPILKIDAMESMELKKMH